jgi:superfamily II DNA helicase RecQ
MVASHQRLCVDIPSCEQIHQDTIRVFGHRPCEGPIKAAIAQLENKTDVVYISSTRSGKTLTFWMPMLHEKESITILVTALNILGQQTAEVLKCAGIDAINITRANAKDETFKVHISEKSHG